MAYFLYIRPQDGSMTRERVDHLEETLAPLGLWITDAGRELSGDVHAQLWPDGTKRSERSRVGSRSC